MDSPGKSVSTGRQASRGWYSQLGRAARSDWGGGACGCARGRWPAMGCPWAAQVEQSHWEWGRGQCLSVGERLGGGQ